MKTLLILTFLLVQIQGICQETWVFNPLGCSFKTYNTKELDFKQVKDNFWVAPSDDGFVYVDSTQIYGALELLVKEWGEYKQACYNDSIFNEYNRLECDILYHEFEYLKSWSRTEELYILHITDSICVVGWYYHKQPTFPEFMDWLSDKQLIKEFELD